MIGLTTTAAAAVAALLLRDFRTIRGRDTKRCADRRGNCIGGDKGVVVRSNLVVMGMIGVLILFFLRFVGFGESVKSVNH